MLVTKAIPNLYNGVSQQAPSVRLISQAEQQTNGFSSIVEGLKKRPPTTHLAKLLSTSLGQAKMHIIDRDEYEQYITVITNGAISIWDTRGNQRTVSMPDGAQYLSTSNPTLDIDCVTVADHTFIVNKRVVVTMDGNTDIIGASVQYRNVIFTSASTDHNYEYQITVNGKTYSGLLKNAKFTNSSGDLRDDAYFTKRGYTIYKSISEMVTAFAAQLALDLPSFNVTASGRNILRIAAKTSGVTPPDVTPLVRMIYGNTSEPNGILLVGDYSAYVTNSLFTGSASGVLKGAVQLFSALPSTGNTVGDIWLVQGDFNNRFTGYYVKWNGNAWVESTEPGINNKLDASTMPHILVRNADGTFTFKKATWNDRSVGGLTTSPNPSFVGQKIASVFFYRNRLGFLSQENVIFSRAGDFFNFYRGSVTAVLDDDPIDVSVSHTKVSLLNHAIPFNRNLLIFSAQTQFILTSESNLTPKEVVIHQTTEFENTSRVKPVASGPNCYFVMENAGWASVHEYFVQDMQATNSADDVTAHVPVYIPAGVTHLEASTNEDLVFVLTEGRPNSVFVYKYYWKGDEKLQSSWSEWVFSGKVLSISMVGTALYLTIQYSDGVYLEKIQLQEGATDIGLPVAIHLDRKLELRGVYDVPTDTTTWTLPYSAANVQLVLDGAYGVNQGQILPITRPSNTTVQAKGRWDTITEDDKGYAIIGVPYEFRYRFSPQYPKDRQGNPLARTKLKVRNWSVFYDKSAYFRAEVSSIGRDTSVYTFSGKRLGEAGMVLGQIATSSGKFSFPVMTDASSMTIDIVNDSYLPCFLQSAEYEGFVVSRARSMG